MLDDDATKPILVYHGIRCILQCCSCSFTNQYSWYPKLALLGPLSSCFSIISEHSMIIVCLAILDGSQL